MAQALSMDLRVRLLAAIDNGLSCRAAGKGSFEYANLQYGRLGRELADEMEFTPAESSAATNQPIWTFTLATGTRDATEAQPSDEYVEWRWKLRPEVVEALSRLGIR